MKTSTPEKATKTWKYNERCICNSRRAIFLNYTHGGRRCTVSVCTSSDGGNLTNWQTKNERVEDLEEYPPVPVGGFRWDCDGFLIPPEWYRDDSEPTPGTESTKENDSEPTPGTESTKENDSEPTPGTVHGCITIYSAGGSARGEKLYYRYQWKKSGKTHHQHIKGGCVGNKTADARAEIIKRMIRMHCGPEQILKVINSW